jgi:hypothetical protein
VQIQFPPGIGELDQFMAVRYLKRHRGRVLRCASENLELHVVVVGDRSAGSAIFAFYGNFSVTLVVTVFKRPDTTAEALPNTAVSDV